MTDQTAFACTLLLPPMPQPRHRCRCFKVGNTIRADSYYDSSSKSGKAYRLWRKTAPEQIRLAFGDRPKLQGPLRLSCRFVFPRPTPRPAPTKWVTRNKRKILNPCRESGEVLCSVDLWKSGERIPHAAKPDLDNLIKALQDAIGDAGVWWDDNRVSGYGQPSKWWAAKGEEPHIWLKVAPW